MPQQNKLRLTVAKNLIRLRKARGLNQETFADLADIDRTHIGNIENARHSISLDILERLADGLGVGAVELLTDQDEEQSAEPIDRLNALFPYIRKYQELASDLGIDDIFQDNGGKLLQTLVVTGLEVLKGREGNDAKDRTGKEYELKTVNSKLTKSFSTHHHLNPTILAKYRQVTWLFCVYKGIELVEIYEVNPADLEAQCFGPWEAKWEASRSESGEGKGKDINNPKIPLKLVRDIGNLIYKDAEDGRIAPGPVSAHLA